MAINCFRSYAWKPETLNTWVISINLANAEREFNKTLRWLIHPITNWIPTSETNRRISVK